MGTPLRRLVRNNRGELQSLARSLNAGDGSHLAGPDATEKKVKAALLSDFQVLAFATHDLVAGRPAVVSEMAVVLTPRAEGTETDDGLLTASEVAQPKIGVENLNLDDLAVARNI